MPAASTKAYTRLVYATVLKNKRLRDLQVKRAEGVSTGNLTADKEVVLSHLGGALSDACSPSSQGVDGDLSGLVNTDGIEIESLDSEARKLDEPVQNGLLPLPKTVLDGSELGQLTHPIGMNTESLEISVLIKVRGFASVAGYVSGGIR